MITEFSIQVKNLSKSFGEFKAVDDVSFQVKKGEIFGFLGPNGSGKSTTIRMLCGLLQPTSGEGIVNGLSVRTNPDDIRKIIGYMSQRFSLYLDLTVRQNMEFWATLYGVKKEKLNERISWVSDFMELSDFMDQLTGSLSGGIKQRLSLSCAILHEPKIVFLDEPTGGVDPISRRKFWKLIDQLAESGITVLVTTHFLDEAEYCHRIGLIYNGKLIALGSPDELKSEASKQVNLELHVSDAMSAVHIIQQHPMVDLCLLFGIHLHLTLKSGYEWNIQSEMNLRHDLAKKGIELSEISIITPALEDVFIHLINKSEVGA